MLLGLWGSFSQWDDEDLVTAKAAASASFVESVLREIQREARQFTLLALKEAGVPPLSSAPAIDLYPRSRVDVLEVYSRPARDAQKIVDSGGSFDEAAKAFEKRLSGIVEADTAIAYRDAIESVWDQLEEEGLTDYPPEFYDPPHDDENVSEQMSREEMEELLEIVDSEADREVDREETNNVRVIGWRRVIRPELSMHGTCGLCVVAATQWYTRGDLKAIHHLCKCVSLPVTKTSDPGLRWNAEDLRRNLDQIYGAAGDSTHGKDLKKIRVVVRDHGELGPILTRQANSWTEKADIQPHRPTYAKPTVADQRKKLIRREEDLEGTLANLKAKLVSGVGDQGGLRAAIWDVEQSLRDLRPRIAA